MARRKLIPKSFELGGRKFAVELVDNLVQDQSAVGLAKYMTCEVKVQKNCSGAKMSTDAMEQAFYHELAHHLYDVMGNRELSQNEAHVDLLGTFLHHFAKSAKY